MPRSLQRFPSRAPRRTRLICFPHAGGPAAAYRPWAPLVPDDVELVAIELPARWTRIAEPALRSIEAIVDALEPELVPLTTDRYALFGHSMGAIVAFELARRLRALGLPPPSRLIVSAARAPHLPREPDIHHLPEPQFLDGVVGYGGMPAAVLDEPGLLEMVLPSLRGDFTAIERWRYRPGPPLEVPISAFGGTEDPTVDRAQLAAWGEHTRAGFEAQQLPGDHFYLDDRRAELVQILATLV